MILWRVFPADTEAPADHPGGPLWFPRQHQGGARHDNPDVYGCLYLAERGTSAVAEALAPFRGRGALREAMLHRAGLPLSLAELELREPAVLVDLDEPRTLDEVGLRPSRVATRERGVTQADALRLYRDKARAAGLRWWSTIEASWINVTVFDRARGRLRVRAMEPLSVEHDAVVEAANAIGLA